MCHWIKASSCLITQKLINNVLPKQEIYIFRTIIDSNIIPLFIYQDYYKSNMRKLCENRIVSQNY